MNTARPGNTGKPVPRLPLRFNHPLHCVPAEPFNRFLSPEAAQRTSVRVPQLFNTRLRALHRDRAARTGPEMFLYKRAFDDCLERIGFYGRHFARALLIGCPDPSWPGLLKSIAAEVDVRDPAPLFASRACGETILEEELEPSPDLYDLVLAIGTLDTVNDLVAALRRIRMSMRADSLFIAAMAGADTLPRLRLSMRAADALSGAAAPHVHPRIEAAALAPLMEQAGFIRPVVDVDRVGVSYRSFNRLVDDLRAMGMTNSLVERPRFIGRRARDAAAEAFRDAGDGERTVETFEILHVAAWTAQAKMNGR